VLRDRVLSAIILIPPVLLLAYWGGLWFLGLIMLLGALAGWEFYALVRRSGVVPLHWAGILAIFAFVASAHWPGSPALLPILTATLIITLIWTLFRQEAQPVTAWAWTLGGALYLGILLNHFVALRNLPQGLAWLTVAVLLTWTNDSAAYFVGRAIGRHKFWPRHSPKKTWEGVFGGLTFAVLVSSILGVLWLGLPWWNGALLGVAISIVGPLGDLTESMVKRQFGAKDSGNLIPGHGGAWDRIDSLLFIVPTVFYWAIFFGGQ
jgi:phosphatidate cytidylyltransferase